MYKLGKPASGEQLDISEKNLQVVFPQQFRLFYTHFNGLVVRVPFLEILGLDCLTKNLNLIHFANIDRGNRICFDCSKLNAAKQWNIVNCQDGFIITLTLASFWSNKIWAWIDKKREIWMETDYSVL